MYTTIIRHFPYDRSRYITRRRGTTYAEAVHVQHAPHDLTSALVSNDDGQARESSPGVGTGYIVTQAKIEQ